MRAVSHLFLNGPVQNGNFTFASEPGKAVGIRIAEALNRILGVPAVPHLWNTVTLAGDLRYRQQATGQAAVSREEFEASAIAAKYDAGSLPPAGTATDTDSATAELAIEMITSKLVRGTLKIRPETVAECARCGHMTGTGQHACRACSQVTSRTRTTPHLVAERRPGQLVLNFAHIHACKRRPPLHLQNIAANTPHRLILSRTRDHGIGLGPLGLPGLVLDPRVGVHVAALAVARRLGADVAVMTITHNAAANIAAYGQHFIEHDGLRLLYALHGRVPYHDIAGMQGTYETYRVGIKTRRIFEEWFLPLFSLKEKTGVQGGQLPALLRYFRKAFLARPPESDHDLLEHICQWIRDGDTDWVMRKAPLATAMRTALDE
jgi:hypothetical protein